MQYQESEGRLIHYHKITNENSTESVTQIEWLPPFKNQHLFTAQCVVLINTNKMNYAQLFTYDRKGLKKANRIILSFNMPENCLTAVK